MLNKAKEGIEKAIKHLESEFAKLQAGRANPAMIEDIRVESYGSLQPIKNVANIAVLDSQTIQISPWDKSQVHLIAKAITESGIGLNPVSGADGVMIKIPALTEERRKDLVKVAKKMAEEGKISVRNARQDSLKDIKKALDAKEISEDLAKDNEADLQKMIDDANKKVDELLKKKEEDIMKV